MKNNLLSLIKENGDPKILIDHWGTTSNTGYAIWDFEEILLWDSSGLYLNNKKLKNESLEQVQYILNQWKKQSKDFAAVGCINYNFKDILFPHIRFKIYNSNCPYLFFIKPKKIIPYHIESNNILKSTFLKIKSNIISKKYYDKKIKFIKDELEKGNTYQINFTMPKIYELNKNSLMSYLQIRNIAKPRFGYYFNMKDYQILSFSPECFFKKINNMLYSYPMKGTRPRSKNKSKDIHFKEELKVSQKDKSEHLMIVDLMRNDIGKIAQTGSVEVDNMFQIKSYETVHQMISCIKGRLNKGINETEIIKALFPGGSITGAPKESAMQIIDELETYSRNIYTGAIGYIKNNGDMNFNISIRTMMIKDNIATYPVGGGIVWESNPTDEWNEAQLKSEILSSFEF